MKKLWIVATAFLMAGCTGKIANTGQQTPAEPVADNVVEEVIEPVVDTLQPELDEATTVRYLETPPADYKEGDEFGLVLDYGGYAMDASAWPMSDGDWLITYHWCMEEDGGIFRVNENGNEVEVIYEDPFEGQPFPVVHRPQLSFNTRNYGGETVKFYASADSDEVLCSTNYMEISLDVIAADLKTRRLLVQSNPNDWCWGEPKDEWDAEYRHPFVDLRGWIDEEWVCGSTVTTCP
ncbi:MAG: hypothetical protein K5920_06190 [Bacteroidales bacterium]|nr:hypothetical protein [Bacteroidales bacterium]